MAEEPKTPGIEIAQSGQRIYEPDGDKLNEFLFSRNHVDVIRGPIGSGTSSVCCMRIYSHAIEQRLYDSKRRSRWFIVRNTYPELHNTTIKTWLDWFPEELYGRMYWERPPHQEIRIRDVELDVHFIALDDEADIKKLRSLEYTGVFFNELEYIPKTIFDECESRTGRFPAQKDGGSNWDGVIGDMNAPNEDHWLPMMTGEVPQADDLTDEERALLTWPVTWGYFVQPPAVLEIRSPDGKNVVGYKTNPHAENLKWLKPGYYEEKVQGKKKAWIDSRLRNQIVFVVDGDPVWSGFNPELHMAAEPLLPVRGHDVIIGMDFGRRPCALFMQDINERIFVQYELRGYNMSSVEFAPVFKRFLERTYPGFRYRIYGDPKGHDKGQATSRTSYDIFDSHGIKIVPPPGIPNNELSPRIEAVSNLLNSMYNGQPRFVLSPQNCPTLKAALSGRYHVKKNALGDREPVKDKFSDIADCLQYAALGLGEGRRMVGLTPAQILKPRRVSGDGRGLLARKVR